MLYLCKVINDQNQQFKEQNTDMKVTLFKPYRKKETINRIDAAQVAGIIQKGLLEKSVLRVRELYNLIRTQRLPDGQIECNLEGGIRLPRVCFAAEFENRSQERRIVRYNGLVVIEINNLKNYDEAIAIREKAKRLPFTMMVFLGASGRSVKILVAVEAADGQAPADEEAANTLYRAAHAYAVRVYSGVTGREVTVRRPSVRDSFRMTHGLPSYVSSRPLRPQSLAKLQNCCRMP